MSDRYILLVDDDPDLRQILAEVLEEEGYRVVPVCHGLEALEHLRASPSPSLILLDLMMPVMDGWRFLEELGHDAALARLPVCVLTAAPLAAAPAPATMMIAKPPDLGKLLALVDRYCRDGA